MPVFASGTNTLVYVNGVDLTAFFAKGSSVRTAEKLEVTAFGAQAKAYIPGQTDQTLQLDGYFDGTASTGIDAQLQALFGLDASLFTVLPNGNALSARGTGFLGFETAYDITSEVASASRVSMQATSEIGAIGLVVIQPKTTFSTIATTLGTTADDNLAATTLGGALHYHVFSLSGTGSPSVTVKWQTSPDQITWTQVATSGAITIAPAYGRIVVAAGVTLDRYSRARIDTAGSTISTVAFGAFHRN